MLFEDDFADAVFVPESALAEVFESAEESFAAFDFFVLAVFVSESDFAEAVESAEESFAVFDFFALVEAADPLAGFESLAESVDFAFFAFDVDDFSDEVPEAEASVESFASVDFFFDLLVFFSGLVVLEALESEACAFAGAAPASPHPSPAEIRNANT